jgi:hypothetical protein
VVHQEISHDGANWVQLTHDAAEAVSYLTMVYQLKTLYNIKSEMVQFKESEDYLE